jgi:hypothetical protein
MAIGPASLVPSQGPSVRSNRTDNDRQRCGTPLEAPRQIIMAPRLVLQIGAIVVGEVPQIGREVLLREITMGPQVRQDGDLEILEPRQRAHEGPH